MPSNVGQVQDQTVSLLIKLGAIMLFSPIFVIPGLIMGALGSILAQFYVKASFSIKREMANAKSPVLASFGSVVSGLGRLLLHQSFLFTD
jgi:hypothetical protein